MRWRTRGARARPHAGALVWRPQVPGPERPLRRPGGGMVRRRLPRVQRAAPADLRRQVALTQRTQGPPLEGQLGHPDPEALGQDTAKIRARPGRGRAVSARLRVTGGGLQAPGTHQAWQRLCSSFVLNSLLTGTSFKQNSFFPGSKNTFRVH